MVALDARLDAWARSGLWRHAAALLVISLVALVRWHHCLLSSEPVIDEETYLAAFRASGAGGSPYDVGSYHYTPFFAWAGSALLGALGETKALFALRATSLIGLSTAVWCSLAWTGASWWRAVAIGVVYVALAPAVGAGFCTGNISFAVIGIILLALTQWPRRSLVTGALPAGMALGASVAAKPLAPLALIALFCHRPAAESRQPGRHLYAGLAGAITAAVLLAPMIPRLAEMAGQAVHPLSYERSFSLGRILSLLGIDLGSLLIFMIGAVVLAALLRLRTLDRSLLVAV